MLKSCGGVFLGFALALMASGAAADEDDCAKLTGTTEILECVDGRAREADAKMDAVLGETRALLVAFEADYQSRYGRPAGIGGAAALDASQAAWATEMRAYCDVLVMGALDGTLANVVEADCHVRRTLARIADLEALKLTYQ